MYRSVGAILFLLFLHPVFSQQTVSFTGKVVSREDSDPVSNATVSFPDLDIGVLCDQQGEFQVELPVRRPVRIVITHVSHVTLDTVVTLDERNSGNVFHLIRSSRLLEDIEVTDSAGAVFRQQNAVNVDPRSAINLPTPFNDFNKILVTLPGVSSNNELSSTYSVRGGNFDENLVYVDDIPIYRPFLANSGRQEGLSFVNPSLVRDIDFYAGGWQAKYGDKLSSTLNIEYKEPATTEGAVSIGLLGGSAYVGGATTSERTKYLVGIRHRDSRYLLNTLEVEGQYFPRYTDVQSMMTFDLTKKTSNYLNRTKLNWLFSYGRNRYLTRPTSQLTEFGAVNRNLRIRIAFIGRELLNYDTYQTGFRLGHWISRRLKTNLILSAVRTSEVEHFDVEGGYRLCDVDNNPGSGTFDDCVITRGVGTQYDYGRNRLDATLITVENRYELLVGTQGILEGGAGVMHQNVADELNEYSFIDSADFISLTHSVFNEIELSAQQFYGYVQYHLFAMDSLHEWNIGLRANVWTRTDQWLLSPRIMYRYKPRWSRPTYFNVSLGQYQQHPFYRELRTANGTINDNVRAQRSTHVIVGMDRFMQIWSRPFLFTIQTYYKFLQDMIPYDVDNLRLRYLADNIGEGFARGIDVRFNGEFIRGTQSWFSLSLLQTREEIAGDGRGAVRRPSDQRINFGAYFEDHMPNDPSVRVYLNLNFGSGFPFGPPGDLRLRNVFSGDEYYRADIGLSKSFELSSSTGFDRIWLRLEILNAIGADNTLSYTWIEDVNGTSFAIPNSLSARFVNVKASVDF